VPSDFNALKSSLALFNLDPACAKADLLAGDNHLAVVSDVAPGALGRRLVNPVDVALSVSCGDPAQGLPRSSALSWRATATACSSPLPDRPPNRRRPRRAGVVPPLTAPGEFSRSAG